LSEFRVPVEQLEDASKVLFAVEGVEQEPWGYIATCSAGSGQLEEGFVIPSEITASEFGVCVIAVLA
jgi:hypothetical protein